MSEVFQGIKENLTMKEVAEHLGFSVNRSGFILSPFKNEKTASCKLYDHSFYDFATNTGGDLIWFTSVILGVDNWQAAKYLADAFSLPLSLSGYTDNRKAIEKRQREQEQAKKKEEAFKKAWLAEVDKLKQLEEKYTFILDNRLFIPLTDYHSEIVRKLQVVRYKLDILCMGNRTDQENILREDKNIE